MFGLFQLVGVGRLGFVSSLLRFVVVLALDRELSWCAARCIFLKVVCES